MSEYQGFKVGDTVFIERKFTEREDGMGPGRRYENSWVSSMDKLIGTTQIISDIGASGVYFVGGSLGYPIMSLKQNPATVGELVNGEFVAATLDDIKDFQRVETKDGIFVVYTNARDAGNGVDLPKFITNGEDKPTKLVLAEVLNVYSQPRGKDILTPGAVGLLRYKPFTAKEIARAKAEIEVNAAAKALDEASARLAAI